MSDIVNVLLAALVLGSACWGIYELVRWIARRETIRILDERDFADLRRLLDPQDA